MEGAPPHFFRGVLERVVLSSSSVKSGGRIMGPGAIELTVTDGINSLAKAFVSPIMADLAALYTRYPSNGFRRADQSVKKIIFPLTSPSFSKRTLPTSCPRRMAEPTIDLNVLSISSMVILPIWLLG